ncbi:restriction endonuclease type II-like protein [Neurospora tetraspora]|uniref:Restriction endonuclease type II-like protein n=1 Tax=Neurospora tetraspora TaxID=94610 RepID=A0AAE0JCJ1_9PEZI|nr:restriction endonuclease type II-like protein [Neurospora tetraspora]
MDDDFDDAELLQALAASEAAAARQQPQRPPAPGRGVVQPTPQRLDKPPPSNSSSSSGPRIVQPTPQPLPGGATPGSRSSGSSILVSPRQKGNPVLASIKSTAWEYSDIPSDYVLGSTTCALFLSLKYHRLHPEYIYTRIRLLQNRYLLRVLLVLVDIPNHEEPLRELSKTSLVNNVTVILCWSAQEAARYLELYKSYEHASASAIRGQQKTTYAERMVEFVTVPRSVNKTDAIALVSTFGSLRNAINAATEANGEERLSVVQGWGEKKVRSWRRAVEGSFRVRKAQGRKAGTGDSGGKGKNKVLEEAVDVGRVVGSGSGAGVGTQSRTQTQVRQKETQDRAGATGHGPEDDNLDEIEAVMASEEAGPAVASGSSSTNTPASRRREEELSGGIAAALAKLRQGG